LRACILAGGCYNEPIYLSPLLQFPGVAPAGAGIPGSTGVSKENDVAKILIVDDDPDILEAGKLVLEKAGHKVGSATNRAGGMKAVDEFKPDLLILDIMMELPDDGIAMAQELRKKGFAAPILMLTSIGRVTGLTYGKDEALVPVDDFQEKPIDSATLVAKVDELLSKKE
jgi:DNA-binding response OmpR family regulator